MLIKISIKTSEQHIVGVPIGFPGVAVAVATFGHPLVVLLATGATV